MRVLVVENMAGSDLGLVGVALSEAGIEIDLRQPFSGDALPGGHDEHDAIVVLGGGQSALDDHTHPYLAGLAALMRTFGDADKSVLGICLGSQLLARGYGAANILGAAREFGWKDVHLTDDGTTDVLLGGISHSFPIFEWHSDTFTLPEGAVHLATNGTAAHQAFRIGRAAYGTQFHFEASKKVVDDWNRTFAGVIEGIDPTWLATYPDHAARHAETADATGLAIARAWVRTI
ncbi:type 1 glutamine amidotransferase [Pararhizobium antarcticum]|uniref:Glutamine amidotransferase n=1 Tax=Pararhizobium antarcticum TaxID=1798805 RepID=A0A657LQP7_9HYPH|nr:type 1 glutamine amidotransferase [Pararhizobium antarcticum]OJF95137.1 glutamine amidotransferase [Pararhizobium antarcticum]OJF98160.1 glutamine amidotransferase [Rhizobium sp. 58]